MTATLPRTVPAEHLPGVTNPRVHLCQEYVMRSRDRYDGRARVIVADDAPLDCSPGTGHRRIPTGGIDTTFRSVAVFLGVDAAIRSVVSCAWLSRDDFASTEPVPCTACLEVRHG